MNNINASYILVTRPRTDWSIFIPAVILVSIISISLVLFPEHTAAKAQAVVVWIRVHLTWLYLVAALAGLLFSCWLAFGPFGHIKLGLKNEAPEYSDLHWVAMMFTAGIGAALISWGFAEPIFYVQSPPMGVEPHSAAAVAWAHVYPMFHWGIMPWAIYTLPTIPVAYMLYVRRAPMLRISATCEAVLPQTGRKTIMSMLDTLIILGIVGGTATALGLGVPMLSAFIAEIFGLDDSLMIKLGVLVLWTLLFGASAYRGLKKGIKVLADINMVLAGMAMLFVIVAGPTLFILSLTVNSLGLFIDNFFIMSLWTDPINKSGFPEEWTMFYWAWWLAYAAFIGLFFGRISRGRTIRQVVLGVIGWGSLGTCSFLAIAGGYSLYLETQDVFSLSQTLTNQGMSVLVTQVISQLPSGKAVLILFAILSIVFFATTLDSAAYVLASICTQNLPSNEEPPKSSRLIWAFALAALTAGLIISGGLGTIQSATIISSLPLIPIIFLMCFSLLKWLKQDFPHVPQKPVYSIDDQ
mgnify:CR=1 FL=1